MKNSRIATSTYMAFFAFVATAFTLAHATPTQLTVDKDVDPTAKPFSKCYQAGKNLKLNGKNILSTAQLVTAFKKAPNYPESEKASKKSACVFLVYNIMKDGRADSVRVMAAEPQTKAFMEAAANSLMALEFEAKEAKDQGLIFTYRAK